MTKTIWELYASSDDPVRLACVAEWSDWLQGVSDKGERNRLNQSLKSQLENRHFSARLELYLHHHFTSQGHPVTMHPDIEGSTDHPDFLVHHEQASFYLEATIRHDEPRWAEMEEFAGFLRVELKNISSPHYVNVSIDQPCPKLEFLTEIKESLEQELLLFTDSNEQQRDVIWRKAYAQVQYSLAFSINRRGGLVQPLEVHTNWGGFSGISNYLFDSVNRKATKYGSLDLPFVITIWGLSSPDQFAEETALYGALVFSFYRDSQGNPVENSDSVRRRPDGVFTLIENEGRRNRKVSAVAFYQHRLGNTGHQHSMRLYHNPFAERPLPKEIFDGYPQFVPFVKDDKGEMRWLGGTSDELNP